MTASIGEPAHGSPDTQRRGRVPADTLSNRLVLARKLDGVTIEEAVELVYERTGERLSKSSWANWEQGMRPQRETDVIPLIAYGLDVDQHWLMFGGPLEGPRGRAVRAVTKRASGDTLQYSPSPVRPMNARPTPGRPSTRHDTKHGGSNRPHIVDRVAVTDSVLANTA